MGTPKPVRKNPRSLIPPAVLREMTARIDAEGKRMQRALLRQMGPGGVVSGGPAGVALAAAPEA
jgi:hypothetical protein